MSERKVLNKYFPPDFDPKLIPRRRQPKNAQQVVRLMAPFSMRCNTCGEFVYKGKKFNARKETVEGETYYSIKIFRFYIRCPQCSAEITFKTDPKNTDYVAEHGASRNFEPWREEEEEVEEDRLARLEEEENDPMKALENRVVDSKREMDIMDALQEIRTRNARLERVGVDSALDRVLDGKGKAAMTPEDLERLQAEEEDEALIRQYFPRSGGTGGGLPPNLNGDGDADDDDDDDDDGARATGSGSGGDSRSGSASDSLPILADADAASMPPPPSLQSGKATSTATAPSPLPTSASEIRSAKKRPATEVEPDVASLLSERAKSMVASSSSMVAAAGMGKATGTGTGARAGTGAGPVAKKKKKQDFGAALGIKIKKK